MHHKIKKEEISMIFDVLEETIGNTLGLMTSIPIAIGALKLSDDQVKAFCKATSNGGELWRKFTERRDSSETPKNYDFRSFMGEVLAGTDFPFEL